MFHCHSKEIDIDVIYFYKSGIYKSENKLTDYKIPFLHTKAKFS